MNFTVKRLVSRHHVHKSWGSFSRSNEIEINEIHYYDSADRAYFAKLMRRHDYCYYDFVVRLLLSLYTFFVSSRYRQSFIARHSLTCISSLSQYLWIVSHAPKSDFASAGCFFRCARLPYSGRHCSLSGGWSRFIYPPHTVFHASDKPWRENDDAADRWRGFMTTLNAASQWFGDSDGAIVVSFNWNSSRRAWNS